MSMRGSTLPTMLQAAESVIGKTQAKRSALADKVYDSHSRFHY